MGPKRELDSSEIQNMSKKRKHDLNAERARDLLFEAILDKLAKSSLFSCSDLAPSIFIVYAHNNKNEGAAYDECVRKMIKWLKEVHAQILSDQGPLPLHQPRIEGINAAHNILANQICLLPPKTDRAGTPTATSVDKVIVCGSEVLQRYYNKQLAKDYIKRIVEICNTGADQSTNSLKLQIGEYVRNESSQNYFHHILTELAFLEVRKSRLPDSHGMVALALNEINDGPPMQYLSTFDDTDVKLKLESPAASSLHRLFFKLLKRLFPVEKDSIQPFIECYDSVSSTIELEGTVTHERFGEIVEEGISKALRKCLALLYVVVRDGKHKAYTAKLSDKLSQALEMANQEMQRNILEWVSPIPISAPEQHGKYNDSGTSRLQGTCDWIIQDKEFCEWHSRKSSALLFLCGNMGTGKTYSTSRVVDWVKDGLSTNDHDEAFAYFYCNEQETERRQVKKILRNIIRQLATGPWNATGRSEIIHKTVKGLWEKSREQGIGSTFSEWEACLLELVDTYPRTTIVLDGLDECEEFQRLDLIKLLVSLGTRHSDAKPVKVFVSTRPEVLRDPDEHPVIWMQEKRNADDIATFVRTKITEHYRWSTFSQEFQTKVVAALLEKSQDMFLFASLQIQRVLKHNTQPAILDCLAEIPKDLNGTYQKIYQDATSHPDERKLLDQALRWVMCSARPLTTNELLFAICQDSESKGVAPQRQDVDKQLILKLCNNFLRLDSSNCGNGPPVWRLAHQAVAEFLGSSDSYDSKLAHYEVGQVCLIILLDTFGGSPVEDKSGSYNGPRSGEDYECPCRENLGPVNSARSRAKHFELQKSLAEYANYAWPTHVRAHEHSAAPIDHRLSMTLQEFLGEPNKGSRAFERWYEHVGGEDLDIPQWCIFASRDVYSISPNLDGTGMTPITLACHLGLYTTLEKWWKYSKLDYKACVVSETWTETIRRNDCGSDRLIWSLVTIACANGEVEILRCLLNRDAEINTQQKNELPAIVAAAVNDSREAACELLKHGAKLRSNFTNHYGPVLGFAIRNSSLEVMELLLRVDPIPHEELEVEQALLHVSLGELRSEQAMSMLLDFGVDVNLPLRDATLLAAAAARGWKDSVRRLLDKGADITEKPEYYPFENALRCAIRTTMHLSTACLLVGRGARLSGRDVECVLRLRQARVNPGGDEILQLLQEHEVNETWTTGVYQGKPCDTSPLMEAVRRGNLGDVETLIKLGADVNLRMAGNGYALNTAFKKTLNNENYPGCPIIETLVKEGAKLEKLSEIPHALPVALAAAAFAGLEGTVQVLLGLGANPRGLCTHKYTTAIAAAAASKHPRAARIVRMLLGGVDTDVEDHLNAHLEEIRRMDSKKQEEFRSQNPLSIRGFIPDIVFPR